MNIFLRELKANLKSLLIWSAIILLLIMIAVAKFSAFAGDPKMLAMLDSMPPALLDAVNMRAFNLTTLSGFYGIMFIYFGLMGAIAAAMWGSDVISKEERDKTVEFSLVLPVSRSRVVTAKALAALVNCFAFVLITWAVSLVAVRSYNPDRAFHDFLALEMQAMLAIELIFLAIGLLLGCAMKQYKLSGSTAVAIILVTYFMSSSPLCRRTWIFSNISRRSSISTRANSSAAARWTLPTCFSRRRSSSCACRRPIGFTASAIYTSRANLIVSPKAAARTQPSQINSGVLMSLIQTHDLTKIYGAGDTAVTALDRIHLTVNAGEFVAVMGPSGCGKSTLLHLLGGLDRPTRGRVIIDGHDLTDLNDARLTELRRRKMGFVFQFFNLIPVLTATENAALPLTLDGVRPAQAKTKAAEWLTKVGLSDRLQNRPDQLSGGQQQRVAVARALVAEPALILADEPTGNLDTHASDEIAGLLRQVSDDWGRAVLMVTHDPRLAAYADRIIFLKDGTIVDETRLEAQRESADAKLVRQKVEAL